MLKFPGAPILSAFLILIAAFSVTRAEPQALRVAVLEYGTVNWELDTIAHYGLDQTNGIRLDVRGVAGQAAAQIAFQGGETDVIVTDWLWVARQRAAGQDYVFIPYSKAVGGVMVPASSEAKTLADLAGGKIGVAGGPVDKTWLILRAYAQQAFDMDLAAEVEPVFGAPPLIFKTALQGGFEGAINFWHFMAKMEAAGMRNLISVDEATKALGLNPETPLLGYVVKGEMVREHPAMIEGLKGASRAAKTLLMQDDLAWERLRPLMRAKDNEEYEALKAGFRAGIPGEEPVDVADAAAFFALMAELGGAELVGPATSLPDGVFLDSQD